MELNINISPFRCYVRRGWFTKTEDWTMDLCYAFAVQSLPGKILTFHIMADYGMMRSRVPLNEIFMNESFDVKNVLSPSFCQLWDCFGVHGAYIEYDFLYGKRAQIILRDKRKIWATYLFTIDWHSNPYSEEASEYKAGHVFYEDNAGQLLLQPNNRIFFVDQNFVTKPFPVSPKEIKVDNEPIVSVESFSDRWVSEDTDCFYYDIEKNP